jgi:hypothetical protein
LKKYLITVVIQKVLFERLMIFKFWMLSVNVMNNTEFLIEEESN